MVVGSITFNALPNIFVRTSATEKTIAYHLADDASKGEVDHNAYTVTDPVNGYYYTGFVSVGTFSSAGLALAKGEFFQADLKGATGVQIAFSSGTFAIELSNDNSSFTAKKYLSTGGTYSFKALMRYVRVLCVSAGTLTDVNLYCQCSTDYYVDTNTSMSESRWTSTVIENRVTLVGHKKGANTDDFNFLTLYATRDNKGVYLYAKEKVSGSLNTSNTDWWRCENFEIHFNNTGVWDGIQLYASLCETNHTNFDLVSINSYKKSNYDRWYNVDYKCYVSYETLSNLSGVTYSLSTDLYIWYGSANIRGSEGFDKCESWDTNAAVKITQNGIVDRNANPFFTTNNHEGGWDENAGDGWSTIASSVADDSRNTLAIHSNAAQNCDETTIGDIVWRTSLLAMADASNHGVGSVFRLDWFHFDFGGFVPDAFNNGSIWEYDGKTSKDTYKYLEVVRDCDIVYVVERNGDSYTMFTCIFPAKIDLVGRGDYVLEQSITTSTQLGAFITSEWSNLNIYKK